MRLGFSSSCGLLSLLLSACPWAAFGEETNELSLPTWRVQAGLFDSSSGQSLGVYHRLSTSWDWGFEVGTDFAGSDNDQDRVQTSSDGTFNQDNSSFERDFFQIDVDLDLRHWGKLQERLSWFLGPRFGGSFATNSDQFRREGQLLDEIEGKSYSTSAGFTVGADFQLLDRLSTTLALLPVSFVYRWSDRDQTRLEVVDGVIQGHEESDEDINSFEVQTSFTPTIYLTLAIN